MPQQPIEGVIPASAGPRTPTDVRMPSAIDMAAKFYHSDPETMSGMPVFVGTRVPIRTLFDYLAGGDSIEVFLDHFPTVTKEKAVALLEIAKEMMDDHAPLG